MGLHWPGRLKNVHLSSRQLLHKIMFCDRSSAQNCIKLVHSLNAVRCAISSVEIGLCFLEESEETVNPDHVNMEEYFYHNLMNVYGLKEQELTAWIHLVTSVQSNGSHFKSMDDCFEKTLPGAPLNKKSYFHSVL